MAELPVPRSAAVGWLAIGAVVAGFDVVGPWRGRETLTSCCRRFRRRHPLAAACVWAAYVAVGWDLLVADGRSRA